MTPFPQIRDREEILKLLPIIFPEGTPNRNYCTRETAASVIFVFLYIGAIEGRHQFLAPVHIYRMTDKQASKRSEQERIEYDQIVRSKSKSKPEIAGKRWYADNSREQIRDETLRDGLCVVGAVSSLEIPTTSSRPRYFLNKDFAQIFEQNIDEKEIGSRILYWQQHHLSPGALARIQLAGLSIKANEKKILVTFPNRETRYLAPGPSSIIAKEVIENFAKQFLDDPVVLWLSESGNKVVLRDNKLAKSIGIVIDQERNLPDLILADVGNKEPSIIFVEIVATDGPVTANRQSALYELTDNAKFNRKNVYFLSAFSDRESAGARKSLSKLAWNSFAWFVSEPDKILIMKAGISHKLKLRFLSNED